MSGSSGGGKKMWLIAVVAMAIGVGFLRDSKVIIGLDREALPNEFVQYPTLTKEQVNELIQDALSDFRATLLEEAQVKMANDKDAAATGAAIEKKDTIIAEKKPELPEDRTIQFTHFLSHIPKSGSQYAHRALISILYGMPEYKALDAASKFKPCNQGTVSTRNYQQTFKYDWKGVRCTMWMSEQPYTSKAEHNYIIVREPVGHTISQYFHCKESDDHRDRANLMPSLDVWLETWLEARNNQTKAELANKFKCYNPTEFQSKWVQFDKDKGKEDLKARFDVMGDNSQMDKSVCLILIRYTGWVPEVCDCTGVTRERRRLAKLDYDVNNAVHAHGVKHHGATFKTTPEQRRMISELRATDLELYPLVKEIFREQVEETERQHGVTICDKFRELDD